MAWKKGPLPKGTFMWGAVVPYIDDAGNPWDAKSQGFFFADFHGDTVKCCPTGRVLKAHEVKLYDNSIELPPQDG